VCIFFHVHNEAGRSFAQLAIRGYAGGREERFRFLLWRGVAIALMLLAIMTPQRQLIGTLGIGAKQMPKVNSGLVEHP
jgi:multisubunit Na+/H+ antiporter MnhB subunit